jgi:hypothetical protein
MPSFNELADDFADGTLDPVQWSGSYGDPTESGGRAHIPCSTGYAGLKSAAAYTLASSAIAVRLHAPDATGAASAAASVLVLSSVGGRDAGFIVDPAQNAIGLWLREGYADAGALFPTYDPDAHAWLRLRETAGTLYWETSPDGIGWTTRRSATSPAWTADTDAAFLIEGHRDAGATTDIAVDSINVSPVRDLGTAQETAQAQPLALGKTLRLGTITVHVTPRDLAYAKARALTTAQAICTAPPLDTGKRLDLPTALQTVAAQPLGTRKAYALTPALETVTAHVLASLTAAEADIQIGQPYTNWEVGQPW